MEPNESIGQYRVVARLGAGGMGTVYRCVDTRLGREVAVKVLAPELHGEEALARFDREARLLAALNHPNVATLFSFEEDAGRRFLVLELVRGEPLSRRLRGGPLPVDEALRLAGQVAEALQAAHEGGIVHRDLKPANIMVLPTGAAKLLDFGIATLRRKSDNGEPVGDDPTVVQQQLTAEHQAIGTPAYMSPEQIRGRPVDSRTDIWAFGCVLYETLTGRRLFDLETVADTMAAVLEREMDLTGLPDDLPAGVRGMLHRCLQRDMEQRARDIWHVRLELVDAAVAGLPDDRLCLRCGQGNRHGDQFCSRCGSSLATECSTCSAALSPGAAFCSACGERLVVADPPVAVQAASDPEPGGADAAGGDVAPPPPDVATSDVATPTSLTAGQRRYVTLVRLAVDGHAELLENLAPAQLDARLVEVQRRIASVAAEHDGVVLNTEAASATLVFGVPTSQEDDASRAVAAALACVVQVGGLEDGVSLRAGVASGACVTREETGGRYFVAGDAERASARLADATRGGRVLLAPETARFVRRHYATDAATAMVLPGSAEAVVPRLVAGALTESDPVALSEAEGLSVFAGREAQLAELERALDAAIAGRGNFVTVVGEAGLGKSRLLYEFARDARGVAAVVYGRSQARDATSPYLPFLSVLRELLLPEHGVEAEDETIAERLAEIDPELADFLPVYLHLLAVPSEKYVMPDHLEDRHLGLAIQQALAAIITQMSLIRPLVLLMEDWHWSDDGSREIVRQLGALLSGFRVLVVVTYRPEYSEDWSQLPHHTTIHLTPLQEAGSAAVMGSVLAATAVRPTSRIWFTLAPEATPTTLRRSAVRCSRRAMSRCSTGKHRYAVGSRIWIFRTASRR